MGELISLQQFVEGRLPERPRGKGAIRRMGGSPFLYVDFPYLGVRIKESTGLRDTPENQKKVNEWLDRMLAKIDDGTFRFAEAFPGASDEKKARFAQLEGWEYAYDPRDVRFGDYLERWLKEFRALEPSAGKRYDYERVINARIRPYFAELPFAAINGVELKRFVLGLTHEAGPRKGERLSGSRIRNILVVFQAIWDDACEEYGWKDLDPVGYIRRKNRKHQLIPPNRVKGPDVFRPAEWFALVEAMDAYYRPIAELMILTGMIASEVAGLRREDVQDQTISIRNSIVRGVEKQTLKTAYRAREIPITPAIRERLNAARPRDRRKYLFPMKSGIPFDPDNFRKNAWRRAFRRAEFPYRTPYATRHTFAAWSLIIGVHPERLVRLMGHGSKKMVYEVYGRYVEGIEADAEKIREYFGSDFG